MLKIGEKLINTIMNQAIIHINSAVNLKLMNNTKNEHIHIKLKIL